MKNIDALFIGAHPDDIEICCGGTVANLTKAGYHLAIVDLTEGELSTRGNITSRRKEAAAASKILKVKERINLKLRDGALGFNLDKDVASVVDVIRKLRPTSIFYPCPIERHPDHVSAHHIVKRAIFMGALKNYQPKLGMPHTVQNSFEFEMRYEASFNVLVDISSTIEIKRTAIESYATQILPKSQRQVSGPPSFLYSHNATNAIYARSAYYGAMVGVAHAEPYTISKIPLTKDPLKLADDYCSHLQYIFPGRIK